MSLFLASSGLQSSELDNLIDTSAAIMEQIDKGIMMTGSAITYSSTGTGLSDGTLSGTAHITNEQLNNYNMALSGMSTYLPYGDIQLVLEEKANTELNLMEDAVVVFTEAVVEMATVQEVAVMSEEASTPDQEAEVQEFVNQNVEVLTVEQDTVDDYNQSLDDIETHANNASAFLAVSASPEATAFLQNALEETNSVAEDAVVSFSQSNQAVNVQWGTMTRMLEISTVFVNGTDDFGINLYMSHADILQAGEESEFYLTGPTSQGYDCFYNGLNCHDEEHMLVQPESEVLF